MSTGADPKTMPVTVAYEDGYGRIYGDRKPVRGKWVWDTAQGKLVPAHEYQAPEARTAPVMVDRFMEGSVATDGTDIGSRAKRREYMAREGVVDSSDVSKGWIAKRREERVTAATEATRRTVIELAKTDRHNLRNAVDALKGKR